MTSRTTARLALRDATSADHDRVDAAFGGFDLGDTREYAAFLPVASALDRIDLSSTLPDWSERRRSDALVADLADLDHEAWCIGDPPRYDTQEAALGAVYVLEGSRLGGRTLARSVADGLRRRFLGAGDPALWRKLIETLDKHLLSHEQMTAAIDAARAVFARFEASARCQRKDTG